MGANSERTNNVAFRLPEDHLRELDRLAAKRGYSKGRLAKEIVMSQLMDFSRFDELSHRLGLLERGLSHVIERLERLEPIQRAVDLLRGGVAGATARLLVEVGRAEFEEAIAWTKVTFGVGEEP